MGRHGFLFSLSKTSWNLCKEIDIAKVSTDGAEDAARGAGSGFLAGGRRFPQEHPGHLDAGAVQVVQVGEALGPRVGAGAHGQGRRRVLHEDDVAPVAPGDHAGHERQGGLDDKRKRGYVRLEDRSGS